MIDPFSTATEIAAAIRLRRVSALERVEMVLDRIRKYNPMLNAVCTLDEAGARARARQAGAALAPGELWGPLHRGPMTLKDPLDTAVGARARAGQAAAALARGELGGPLQGVPRTIKDALETAGVRPTGGYPPLSN